MSAAEKAVERVKACVAAERRKLSDVEEAQFLELLCNESEAWEVLLETIEDESDEDED